MIDKILKDFKSGKISELTAKKKISELSFVDIGFAKIDSARKKRTGTAEVVFGQTKTPAQIVRIIREILKNEPAVLATRLSQESISLILKNFPKAKINEIARTAIVGTPQKKSQKAKVSIVTAGTADMPVAEDYYSKCLALPMYPSLTDEEQEFIIRNVLSFINQDI